MSYTKITNFAIKDSTNDIIKGTEFDDEFNSIEASFTAQPSATQTLTNKTVALGSNTVSGTFAQFNTAVTDAELARTDAANTFTGTQTFGDLTTTGNTILGNASTDTLNVGNGDLIKDASGNLGLGVTPSAWGSAYKSYDLKTFGGYYSTDGGYVGISANAYTNGTNWIYKGNTTALRYEQTLGSTPSHSWLIAPSGTAGNPITFTQAMTLDASGNITLGATTPIISTNGTSTKMYLSTTTGASSGSGWISLSGSAHADAGTSSYNAGTGGKHIFKLASVDAMTLDASGNLLVGTASDVTNGGFKFWPSYSRIGSSAAEIGHISGSASGEGFAIFKLNNTAIGTITQNGTTAVLYNTTSDYRLKNDVVPIQNALSTITALNPVSFTWVDGRPDDGFIAHELQAVLPNCVTGEKDAVNEDGTPKYQQMDSSGVVPFLVKAIQEQQALITQQSLALTSLTARLELLEAK